MPGLSVLVPGSETGFYAYCCLKCSWYPAGYIYSNSFHRGVSKHREVRWFNKQVAFLTYAILPSLALLHTLPSKAWSVAITGPFLLGTYKQSTRTQTQTKHHSRVASYEPKHELRSIHEAQDTGSLRLEKALEAGASESGPES